MIKPVNTLRNLIKKLVGKNAVNLYHLFLSWLAARFYGSPSEKLIVIGVTGTNGKSTTVNLIAKILEQAGHKVALSSTVNFKIAEREWLNDLKLTMPGRFFLQRLLNEALKAGCTHAVMEVSSEGIEQFRHRHIHFDLCVFTNLTPEHIEAHGGFENYKQAKLKLFRHLADMPKKGQIPRSIVANLDDPHARDFMNFEVDQVVTFGKSADAHISGKNLALTMDGISFEVGQINFQLKLRGMFDFYNALAAMATAKSLGIDLSVCKQALEKIPNVPGRMELIDGRGFKVLVDYAPEPESLRQMYQTIKSWPKARIIHILGSTGGGRDKSRREVLGEIAGHTADIVIVTNEDPYDDDPMEIIDGVAAGVLHTGKRLNMDLFKEIDRRKAIKFALSQAKPNDLVVITGKGAEQKMAVKGGYIPWDDRRVVQEELNGLKVPQP